MISDSVVWPRQAAPNRKNFLDHFSGASLEASRWVGVTSGTGAVSVTDSYVECNAPSNSAAFIYHPIKINTSVSQLWQICLDVHSAGATYPFVCCGLLNRSAGAPMADTEATNKALLRAWWSFGNPTGGLSALMHYAASGGGTETVWDKPGEAWGAVGAAKYAVQPIRTDDYYVVEIEIDGVNSRWRMLQKGQTYVSGYTFDQGDRRFTLTNWVSWSSVEASADLWLVIGQPYTNVAASRVLRVEWVRYIESNANALIEGWSSAKGTQATGHTLRHYWSYDGKVFVPEDRATDALVPTGGAWEGFDLQCPIVVRDGSGTDYLFYFGVHSGFIDSGIGVATAPTTIPQNGPWTRAGSNPKIATVANNTVRYAFVFKDHQEPDAQKRWKCVYAQIRTSDFKEEIRLATAPHPPDTSTWTLHGVIIPVGGAGAKDEFNCYGMAGVVYLHGTYEVWYTGEDASGTHLLRAFGPSLLSLTKDATDYSTFPSVTEALTANLTGRTVTVASTTGFVVDAQVLFDDDTTGDNYGTSRIRKILSSTQLELYHGLDGFLSGSPSHMRQIDGTARDGGQIVMRVGSEWWFYRVQWGAFDNDAGFGALCEQNMLYTHSGELPSSQAPLMDHAVSPIIPRGFNSDLRSVENMGLLMTPLDITQRKKTGTRPAPFAPGLAR